MLRLNLLRLDHLRRPRCSCWCRCPYSWGLHLRNPPKHKTANTITKTPPQKKKLHHYIIPSPPTTTAIFFLSPFFFFVFAIFSSSSLLFFFSQVLFSRARVCISFVVPLKCQNWIPPVRRRLGKQGKDSRNGGTTCWGGGDAPGLVYMSAANRCFSSFGSSHTKNL